MKNDLPPELSVEEADRHAYNAAFYELGLHWHWDSQTYSALLRECPQPEARIRRYMEAHQPHLLSAYDADFLAAAIHERKQHVKPCGGRWFDWSQAGSAWELGV